MNLLQSLDKQKLQLVLENQPLYIAIEFKQNERACCSHQIYLQVSSIEEVEALQSFNLPDNVAINPSRILVKTDDVYSGFTIDVETSGDILQLLGWLARQNLIDIPCNVAIQSPSSIRLIFPTVKPRKLFDGSDLTIYPEVYRVVKLLFNSRLDFLFSGSFLPICL